jgi:L-fuconolactonase
MMRVDSHHHFWRLERRDYAWLTVEQFPSLYHDFLPVDIAPLLQQRGIDETIRVRGAETVAEPEIPLGVDRFTIAQRLTKNLSDDECDEIFGI